MALLAAIHKMQKVLHEPQLGLSAGGSGESDALAVGGPVHLQVAGIETGGKRIAFTASSGGEPELWFMEDFLPLVNGRK